MARTGKTRAGAHDEDDYQTVKTPDGWPFASTLAKLFNPAEAAQRAAAGIGTAHVTSLLKAFTPKDRSVILRSIMPSAASVNPGMAARVRTEIIANPLGSMARQLLTPLHTIFSHVELSPTEWAAFVGGEAGLALSRQTQNERLIGALYAWERIDAAFHPLAYVLAITAGDPCGALALAYLAQTDSEALSVYEPLFEKHPGLPPIPPASLAELSALRRQAANAPMVQELPGAHDALLPESVMDADTEGPSSTLPGHDGEPLPVEDELNGHDETVRSVQDVLADVELAEARWSEASTVAEGVALTLAHRQLPALTAIADLTGFVDWASHLVEDLGQHVGSQVGQDLVGIADAADELRGRLQETDEEWLDRLEAVYTHLPDVAAALRALQESVQAAAEDPAGVPSELRAGVSALLEMIDLVGEQRDGKPVFADLMAASQRAQEGLVGHGALVFAAGQGALLFADDTVAGPDETGADDDVTATHETESGTDTAESVSLAGETDTPIDYSDLDELLLPGPEPGGWSGFPAGSSPRTGAAKAPASRKSAAARNTAAASSSKVTPGPDAGGQADADDPKRKEQAAEIARLEPGLLASARFGLAADLREAAGDRPAMVAARRLAAYANQLRRPTDAIAAAFAENAPKISLKELSDDRDGQLVAWACAVRVSILAPSVGAAAVIGNLEHAIGDHENLLELGRAFADGSRDQIIVVAESPDSVAALRAADEAAAEQSRLARELQKKAQARTIRYIPAVPVYQHWMSLEGDLGQLLEPVTADRREDVERVQRQLIALRERGADDAIDATFGQIRSAKNRRKAIIGGARQALHRLHHEALEIAGAWADAAATGTAVALQTPGHDWLSTPLARLRARVRKVRAEAFVELEGITDTNHNTLEAVRLLLHDAIETAEGKPPLGKEVVPGVAAHLELIGADLDLLAPDLMPAEGRTEATVEAMLTVARAPKLNYLQLFESRSERGDHDITAILVEAASRVGDPNATELFTRRREAVHDRARGTAATLRSLVTDIDTARMKGTLGEDVWSRLAGEALGLQNEDRHDFGKITRDAERLRAELGRLRAEKIAECQDRITERANEDSRVKQYAEHLLGVAEEGDVASADELLEQVGNGGSLAQSDEYDDHFAAFYPAIPAAFAKQSDLIDALLQALEGQPGTREDAGKAIRGARLDPRPLSRSRREDGAAALRAWNELRAPGSGARHTVEDLLRPILAEAGMEFTSAAVNSAPKNMQGRHWIDLSGVQGVGRALTPALGSAMAPSGSTLRVLLVRQAPSPATLIEWMAQEPANQTVFALWLGGSLSPADRRSIAEAARHRHSPVVIVVDVAILAYLVCQPEPRRTTLAALTLPFTAASPYRDTPGDTPPEMFFGRDEELAAVRDLNGPSIFYGGRQLGKSALLRTAKRLVDGQGEYSRAVLVSIFTIGGADDADRLWPELWTELAQSGVVSGPMPVGGSAAAAVLAGIQVWLDEEPKRTLLIMLDEADAFLEADAKDNRFTNVHHCRDLMEVSGRRVKVVFAGLHRTARFESLQNQPLAHLREPVLVGPLSSQAAYNLLTKPLQALGYRFEDPIATPARILARTNNMPALLQLFGEALMRRLAARPVGPDAPPALITDEDVDSVTQDAELSKQFRGKYVLTLHLDHRYLVIAYVVAYAAYDVDSNNTLTLSTLYDRAKAYWPAGFADATVDEFRALVDECRDLGVLARDAGGYRMRTPAVQRLLGTEFEVVEVLESAAERLTVPSTSDLGSYRHKPASGVRRMPLTERQLGNLLALRSQVLFVTGSPALGIERVAESIDQRKDAATGRRVHVEQVSAATPSSLRQAINRLPKQAGLVVCDLQAANTAVVRSVSEVAREAVRSSRRQLTILLVCTSTTAPVWIKNDDRIALSRVDRAGLRLWSNEEQSAFYSQPVQDTLLAESGGWPDLVEKALTQQRAIGELSARDCRDLVNSVGLGVGGDRVTQALVAVFGGAVEFCDQQPEDIDGLAHVLDDDGRLDKALRADFGGIRDVLDALRLLGCLDEDESGLVRPEPVLAAAFRRVHAQ